MNNSTNYDFTMKLSENTWIDGRLCMYDIFDGEISPHQTIIMNDFAYNILEPPHIIYKKLHSLKFEPQT